tara:strand:+ start:45 stop:1142 length:1098 start_codon:yes stop_codon:yes gene_type:complete
LTRGDIQPGGLPRSALDAPPTDPTSIFEAFRGCHSTELLTAAVAHFEVFAKLEGGALEPGTLREVLGLAERPFVVLTTALKAMGLLVAGPAGKLDLAPLAREHLLEGGEFYVGDYVRLAADSPSVLEMVERLRTDRPRGSEPDEGGAAYIYRDGIKSAMEDEEAARFLTMALAGRASNVAPLLARAAPLEGSALLLDVAAGSGIYSAALLQANPGLRAIAWERPEVVKVALDLAGEYGLGERLECVAADMFTDDVPEGVDTILLSNVLHDWDVPECRELVARLARALPAGGKLLVHDVFLNDELDGPLPIALYSAALFSLTEGRAYSAAEYRSWMEEAGLVPGELTPTLIHCGVLPGVKSDEGGG